MGKIKISIHNLYKNIINYNIIGGASITASDSNEIIIEIPKDREYFQMGRISTRSKIYKTIDNARNGIKKILQIDLETLNRIINYNLPIDKPDTKEFLDFLKKILTKFDTLKRSNMYMSINNKKVYFYEILGLKANYIEFGKSPTKKTLEIEDLNLNESINDLDKFIKGMYYRRIGRKEDVEYNLNDTENEEWKQKLQKENETIIEELNKLKPEIERIKEIISKAKKISSLFKKIIKDNPKIKYLVYTDDIPRYVTELDKLDFKNTEKIITLGKKDAINLTEPPGFKLISVDYVDNKKYLMKHLDKLWENIKIYDNIGKPIGTYTKKQLRKGLEVLDKKKANVIGRISQIKDGEVSIKKPDNSVVSIEKKKFEDEYSINEYELQKISFILVDEIKLLNYEEILNKLTYGDNFVWSQGLFDKYQKFKKILIGKKNELKMDKSKKKIELAKFKEEEIKKMDKITQEKIRKMETIDEANFKDIYLSGPGNTRFLTLPSVFLKKQLISDYDNKLLELRLKKIQEEIKEKDPADKKLNAKKEEETEFSDVKEKEKSADKKLNTKKVADIGFEIESISDSKSWGRIRYNLSKNRWGLDTGRTAIKDNENTIWKVKKNSKKVDISQPVDIGDEIESIDGSKSWGKIRYDYGDVWGLSTNRIAKKENENKKWRVKKSYKLDQEKFNLHKAKLELEKEKFDAENYTLADCRKNIQEYKFYNLRNQIEMSKLMTKYKKNEYIIKNLLKDNNFDFAKVEKKLEGESGAAEGKKSKKKKVLIEVLDEGKKAAAGKGVTNVYELDEGKIIIKVPKLY